MATSESRTVGVEVKLVEFAYGRDAYAGLSCLKCAEPLHIHQPEPGHPERMLETCPACGDWYMLDYLPDHSRAVMVLLPDNRHFLRLLEAPGRPSE